MDQALIIDSISAHLGLLESAINWSIVAALATIVAGTQQSDEMQIAGISVTKHHAFVVMCVTFTIVNLAIAITFFRIGLLLDMVDDATAIQAITALATHKWILNPFTHVGDGAFGRVASSHGLGTLIFVWWTCNSSLIALLRTKSNRTRLALLAAFLVVGCISSVSVEFAYDSFEYLSQDLPTREASEITRKINMDFRIAYFFVAFGSMEMGILALVLLRSRNDK